MNKPPFFMLDLEASPKVRQLGELPEATTVVSLPSLVPVRADAAGIILGLLGGRIMRGDAVGSMFVTLPPVAADEGGVAEPPESPVEEPIFTAASSPDRSLPPPVRAVETPLPPRLYSEADLMAVIPEEERRLAIMRAEWFITNTCV